MKQIINELVTNHGYFKILQVLADCAEDDISTASSYERADLEGDYLEIAVILRDAANKIKGIES